tara:strand:+ start:1154 stop:1879 length:726 start_codon:yes stop_codon:yes gene_type:complete
MPTTIDNDTELSAVNSILGSIGQSPVNNLNFNNPEIEFIYSILTEVNKDVQNEGWQFNLEEDQVLTMKGADLTAGGVAGSSNTGIEGVTVDETADDSNIAYIKLADTVLSIAIRKGSTSKTVEKTQIRSTTALGRHLYDLANNIETWDCTDNVTYTLDVSTLYAFANVPNVFQRYITYRSAVRAATQLIANPQLVQLLQLQEVTARANCLEYEGKQGDHSFFGLPNAKRLHSQLLNRASGS